MKTVSIFDMEIIERELESQLTSLELSDGFKRLIFEEITSYVGFEIEFVISDERPGDFKIKIFDDEGEEMYLEKSQGDRIEKVIYDHIKNQFGKFEIKY
jgi:hypothetical protein